MPESESDRELEARKIRDLMERFEEAFNSADADELEKLFDADAALVLEPGKQVSGEARIRRNRTELASIPPIRVSVRHVYFAGDTALLINDYVHEGRGADGRHVRFEGTAADVAKRGADGVWRCVISNPAGTGRAGAE